MGRIRKKINISEWMHDAHAIINDMCNKLHEFPTAFYPPMYEMFFYIAAHNHRVHTDRFYTDLFQFGHGAFCKYLDSHTTYIEYEGMQTLDVESISSVIPHSFNWKDELELEDTADMLTDAFIDMVCEYDLNSNKIFLEISDELIMMLNASTKDFTINLSRRYISAITHYVPINGAKLNDSIHFRLESRSQSRDIPRLG